jgi:high-affinity nickel permease
MKSFLAVVVLMLVVGCRSHLDTSDHLRAIGTVTRVTPASGEGKSRKGVAFEFRVQDPASSRGLIISYEMLPFSLEDVSHENDVASMVGKKVSIRILKSDLKEASPDMIFLRTPSSLDIRIVGSSSAE